jgi:hypothetical protein
MLGRFYRWVTSRPVVRVLLWILHFVLLAAVLVGLWWVNHRYQLDVYLLSPFPRLHPYWLPLLFLLAYLGAWLGYWFFRLLADPATGEHPDIDAAWADALTALDAAGIDMRDVPLFLVVGTPRSGVADFFAATRQPFAVRGEPRGADAPVTVFASREAIYVAAPGASALGAFALRLPVPREAAVPPPPTGAVNLLDAPGGLGATGPPAEPPPTSGVADWLPAPDTSAGPTLGADARDHAAGRLRYLCALVAERRRPFCGANGIVWLIPTAATTSSTIADEAAAAVRADARAAEAGLQVVCPSTAVVCDAQDLDGFRDLLRGVPDSLARERVLGRSFPLVPAVPPDERAAVIAGGLDWLARQLVPGAAYQRFGTEADGTGARWDGANPRLWALTAEVAARRDALVRVLAQGLAGGSGPPLLAGAYLCGTGPDARDQAFAAGVLQQLVGLQDHVAWTDAADAAERDYRRMTVIGYVAAACLVVAVVVFGYSTWR